MNVEALLALIGDLYAQIRAIEIRVGEVERERDQYKSMLDAVKPDHMKAPPEEAAA